MMAMSIMFIFPSLFMSYPGLYLGSLLVTPKSVASVAMSLMSTFPSGLRARRSSSRQ